MATHVPCKKNDTNGYVTYVSLVSQATPAIFQVNPTLAAGDVKIAIDDAAPANIGTIPAVDGDFTKRLKVVLSQAETNGDVITIIFSDAAGSEWCDLYVTIHTAAQTLDEVDTVIDAITASGPTNTQMNTAHALLATPAQVNTEVLDVLNTDTFGESASIPAATSTIIDKIKFLFTLARNKMTQTATTTTLLADDESTPVGTSTVSDDGTTFTRGEYS